MQKDTTKRCYKFSRLDAGKHQGKTISINQAGELVKEYAFPATLWSAETVCVEDLRSLYEIMNDWKEGLVMTTGIISPDKLSVGIRRNKDNFSHHGPGVLTVDGDELQELCHQNSLPEFESLGDVVSVFRSLHPELEGVGVVATSSSSSFINGGPLKGVHLHILTDDTSNNPKVLDVLHSLALAKGLGRWFISGIGVLLVRSLVDTALKTPCQPIFEGKPKVKEGSQGVNVERRVEIFGGNVLDSSSIKIADAEREAADEVIRNWKKNPEVLGMMELKKKEWIEMRIEEGMAQEKAKSFVDKVHSEEQVELPIGLVVHLDSGEKVTVGDILDAPDGYHETTCRDPLDPAYGPGRAKIFPMGPSPTIHSFAHGEATYRLPTVESRLFATLEKTDQRERLGVLAEWTNELGGVGAGREEMLIDTLKRDFGIPMGSTRKLIKSAERLARIDDNTSQVGLAESFSETHGQYLKFDYSRDSWYVWGGEYWERDEQGRVDFRVKEWVKSEAYGQEAMLTSNFLSGTMKILRAEQGIGITGEEWDVARSLLGTPTGTVDLKTGQLFSANPDHLITKITEVSPEDGCTPLWDDFLFEIMSGDQEMIDYLQLVLGYAITGEIREEVLFCLIGPGGNGKGTLMEVLARILGPYFCKASSDTFILKRGESHPTDVAYLQGKRLVLASETDSGKKWDLGKVKDITAPDGGVITARGMHQDFSSFEATSTIFISTNYALEIASGKDVGLQRRLHLVPFRFTPKNPDRNLKSKLVEGEGPQILSWLIEGARRWYELNASGGSIKKPRVVIEETRKYFDDQDTIGRFVLEVVKLGDLDEKGRISSHELYISWREWAEKTGEKSKAQKSFVQSLKNRFPGLVDNVKGSDGKMRISGLELALAEVERLYSTEGWG